MIELASEYIKLKNAMPQGFIFALKGFGWLFSSIIGSLITYCFTRRRDKKADEKKENNELVSVSNAICFYLALQQSELTNLKKNIEDRSLLIKNQKKPDGLFGRDFIVQISQDFPLYKDISINIENACKVILSAAKNKRGVTEVMQSVFISNKWYFKTIEILERYHEAKREMSKDKYFHIYDLIRFLEANIPSYEKIIEEAQGFGKKSLESVKEWMDDNFGIKINVAVGDTVKLN